MRHPVQDDITVVLLAQKIIVHETVRLNVSINAQVEPGTLESGFRNEIQSTLKRFIDTDWKIQSISRSKGINRYETVLVSATARVPEKENYQLQERATQLSRIGFELANPTVDYSLSFDEVQKVNAELRLDLLAKILAETKQINDKIFGNSTIFRVSSARFDNGDPSSKVLNAYGVTTPYAASMSPQASGRASSIPTEPREAAVSASAEEPRDLNVSTRFSMTGTFVLRDLVK